MHATYSRVGIEQSMQNGIRSKQSAEVKNTVPKLLMTMVQHLFLIF